MTSVLVTGGDGYVGSQCAIALMDAGYDVAVLDNHSTGFKSIGDALSAIPSDGSFLGTVQGDLLDLAEVDSALERWDVDAVMHFAAFSQVAESVSNPSKYYRNNVIGTMNLLDSMRSHDVDMIVYSSSAAVYGEPKYLPIDESHPREPISPYGRTKLCVEHMMDDYDLAYGIRSVRLRYFNVAGADSRCRVGECHDPETHLIPSILRSTFNGGETFQIFGADYGTRDGTCIRDYVNVEDLADAHVLALKYLENGGRTDFFNLGTNEGSTVREVFSTCERITGRSIPLEMGDRRPGDPASLVADNKKAKAILGWNPIRTLEDSIRTAYAWEKKKREP